MSETEVTVRGHLGHNPELQKSAAGKPWLRMRIATNRRIRTSEGWESGPTSWYDVKAFGALAENVAESLRKGDGVIVQGPLDIEDYTTENGVPMRAAVIRANAVGPDLRTATVRVTKVHRNEAGEIVDPGQPTPPVDVSNMHELVGEGPHDDTGEDADAFADEEVEDKALAPV